MADLAVSDRVGPADPAVCRRPLGAGPAAGRQGMAWSRWRSPPGTATSARGCCRNAREPPRPSPARRPFGLAWRLQRAAFLGWLAAFVLLSLVVGQIVTRIGDMLSTPVARQLITVLGASMS